MAHFFLPVFFFGFFTLFNMYRGDPIRPFLGHISGTKRVTGVIFAVNCSKHSQGKHTKKSKSYLKFNLVFTGLEWTEAENSQLNLKNPYLRNQKR